MPLSSFPIGMLALLTTDSILFATYVKFATSFSGFYG
ncbi:hypothetical protein NIT7645_01395 [Phaeobacter italicus]|nr:hypothetical protein NIT7645_01395 [Phaeobacter italicus]SFG27227.1 hypothetical protein SAMN04488019_101732 [Phaeobacter italicus]